MTSFYYNKRVLKLDKNINFTILLGILAEFFNIDYRSINKYCENGFVDASCTKLTAEHPIKYVSLCSDSLIVRSNEPNKDLGCEIVNLSDYVKMSENNEDYIKILVIDIHADYQELIKAVLDLFVLPTELATKSWINSEEFRKEVSSYHNFPEFYIYRTRNIIQVTSNINTPSFMIPKFIKLSEYLSTSHPIENTISISSQVYDKLNKLGLIPSEQNNSVRDFNVGSSDYSQHVIQPWSIWQDYPELTPWDCDIVKRILRTKEGQTRLEEYEKIIHICEERIRQLKLSNNA